MGVSAWIRDLIPHRGRERFRLDQRRDPSCRLPRSRVRALSPRQRAGRSLPGVFPPRPGRARWLGAGGARRGFAVARAAEEKRWFPGCFYCAVVTVSVQALCFEGTHCCVAGAVSRARRWLEERELLRRGGSAWPQGTRGASTKQVFYSSFQ